MREHQIVITLKPEQFSEVQRLARAANAKSMGIFVRQRLLAALGIDGVAPVLESKPSADLEPVIGQMKRLHAELKMFVAESLSLYREEFEAIPPAPGFVESDSAQQITPLENTASADELERLAERVFSISPRLGAIDSAQEEELPPVVKAAVPPGSVSHKSHELYARRELHQRDNHRYGQQNGRDVLDTPFSGNEAPAQDKPVVRDPLDQLLPASETKTSNQLRRKFAERDALENGEDDDDDDLVNVPLSIAERRKQFDENELFDSEAGEEAGGVKAPTSVIFSPANPELAVAIAESESESTPPHQEAPSAAGSQGSISVNDSAPNPGRTASYPPLSGSPPPKRRPV